MPLFYQHNINEATKLGIWRIEEPEDFFLQKVPLHNNVSHPYKKLQHLAGRYLLPILFEDFPLEEIIIADTKKPFLDNEKYHFSISHSGNFVAAIASKKNKVGVDVELVTSRIKNISDKFLSDSEKKYINNWEEMPQLQLELTTVYWSAKEAIFKWYGKGEIDFREHIEILSVTHDRNTGVLDCMFKKDENISLVIHYHLFATFVAAWVCT
jgi:phosphopantetheinyl transferase